MDQNVYNVNISEASNLNQALENLGIFSRQKRTACGKCFTVLLKQLARLKKVSIEWVTSTVERYNPYQRCMDWK